MRKKKALKNITQNGVSGYVPPTAEENYQRKYGFQDVTPARSPVSGWELGYIKNNSEGVSKRERSLVMGTPHKFKGVRTGNSYSKKK